jgi:ferredoxin
MGLALSEKGFTLAGAAKVAALHSMTADTDNPLGDGRPDANDDRAVAGLVADIQERLENGEMQGISVQTLDYQPPEIGGPMKEKLHLPWQPMPKQVVEEKCTECGICEEECPVGAITLSPLPEFSDRCFDCFTCARVCPENAVVPDINMQKLEANIRKRYAELNEQPKTQTFSPG